MYWSTEDHHLRQNYYNSLQSVQHQNGLQQATAAMPPHQQQQLASQPTIIQQQQQQQQQHQQHQQQQQQQHRPAQQIQSHFANQHQFQTQHHQQWPAGRPAHILTLPPFMQQYPNNVPSSTQFCAPPPNYYQTQPQYPQTSGVSATPQQRQCVPQGCTLYTMPPQATALRQSVITQPPTNIMTPTTSAAQQLQVQYFPTFCQPPLLGQQPYGPVMSSALNETHVAKPRKYAIPIIHPDTKENIMEKKYRSNESPDADGTSSFATTPSSTSIDDLKEPRNDVTEDDQVNDDVPQIESNIEEIREEDITDASPPAVLDHVESIEPNEEEVEQEAIEIERKTPCEELTVEADDQAQSSKSSIITTPIDTQDEKIQSGDDDKAPPPPSSIEGNISAPLSVMEPPDDENPLTTESTEEKHSSSSSPEDVTPDVKVSEQSKIQPMPLDPVDEKVGKDSKTQPTPPTLPPPTQPTTTKLTSKKTKRNSKRLKESQKKQKADLMKSENNNTNKATNQNENNKAKATDKFTDPCNSTNRLKTKAKESSKNNSSSSGVKRDGVTTTTPTTIATSTATTSTRETTPASVEVICSTETTTTTTPDACENSEESSLQADVDSTETLNTYDENDHSSSLQLDDSPKIYKTEEISSKILGIKPTDENEFLFLNSSVSGYEEDICPSSSPTKAIIRDDEKIQDILFGDFSEVESSPQELVSEESNEKNQSIQKTEGDDKQQVAVASSVSELTEKRYTLKELRSLSEEPASKLPPSFRGQICEIIGKNPRDSSSGVQHQQMNQQNNFFPQMSYKDSISLNRRRNKQPFQQQQQQMGHQQQQQGNRDIIRIYLPLNEDVKLAESENAWVPQALKDFGPKTIEDDEQILKKIRGILNKLTPENFDKLLHSASSFPMKTVERMNKVMLLIFEKTVSEPNFAPTYARFCKFLFNPDDSNHAMFKAILVRRIQDEFDGNVNNAKAKEAKLKPLMERLAAATDAKEKLEIKAELDDQEYQFRRRAWGTVRFIGEMCKMGFIRIDRVCACVESLLDVRCEEKLEFMCKLLSTVGPQLEVASQQPGYDKEWAIKERLDKIFTKIRQVIEKKNQGAGQKISSRVRFMMQDIVDLRARFWDQKETATVALPQREVSPAVTRGVSNSQQQRGARSFMPPMSGGYDKKRSQNNENQQKNTSIDRSKLSFNFSDDIKLGNSSPLWQVTRKSQPQNRLASPTSSNHQSRSLLTEARQTVQPTQPQPPQDLSDGECDCLLNGLIETVKEAESPSEWFVKWNSIPAAHQVCIINYVLTEYLHPVKCELDLCTRLFVSLFKENLITRKVFREGYEKFSETWSDILVNDVPNGWIKIFKFLGPSLHLELVEINAIWDKRWFNTLCGDRFLQSMIMHFTSEFGANYMRYFWDNNSLSWSMFLQEDRIQKFIATYGFQFIDDLKCVPPMFIHRSTDDLVLRIKELLAQSSQDLDIIIDFISTNVRIDCEFVRSLTMFLCDYSVIFIPSKNSSNSTKKSKVPDISTTSASSTYKLRPDIFVKNCIPLLRLCIDSNDEHELSCLNAIVTECNRLPCDKFPVDLLHSILLELYGEVISKESFEKWREQLSTVEGDISKDLDDFLRKLPI